MLTALPRAQSNPTKRDDYEPNFIAFLYSSSKETEEAAPYERGTFVDGKKTAAMRANE